MNPNESITIIGARRFSNYKGYSNKTTFEGSYEDDLNLHCRTRVISAIDSLRLKGVKLLVQQFYPKDLHREIFKSYVGFIGNRDEVEVDGSKIPVTTGRWGCGAYSCNPLLKFLIQWIS